MNVISSKIGGLALLAMAGCSSKSEAPRANPVATPPAQDLQDATRAIIAPHGCPPSAYRNGGNALRPVIEAVFPDCPPAELDEALVCVGRACERPCKVTTVSTVRKEEPLTFTLEVSSDAAGRRDYIKRGDSLESFTYDPEGRLASWEPAPLPPHVITRNAEGWIVSVAAGERSWSFTYDLGLGRRQHRHLNRPQCTCRTCVV